MSVFLANLVLAIVAGYITDQILARMNVDSTLRVLVAVAVGILVYFADPVGRG